MASERPSVIDELLRRVSLGRRARSLGRRAEAREILSSCLAELLGMPIEQRDDRAVRLLLATLFDDLGNLARLAGQMSEAKSCFDRGMALAAELSAHDADDASILALAEAHWNLHLVTEDCTEEVAHLKHAIAVLEPIRERLADSPRFCAVWGASTEALLRRAADPHHDEASRALAALVPIRD